MASAAEPETPGSSRSSKAPRALDHDPRFVDGKLHPPPAEATRGTKQDLPRSKYTEQVFRYEIAVAQVQAAPHTPYSVEDRHDGLDG
jgi:hypothetical protein